MKFTYKALINGILVSAPQVVPPRMRAGGIPLSLLLEKCRALWGEHNVTT